MAKDALGREITDPALMRMQASMNKEPVLTTVGRGLREGAGAVAAGAKERANIADESLRIVGVPAAAAANVFGQQLANLKSGLQGTPVKAPEYQGLTFSQLLGGKSAAPAIPGTTKPGMPVSLPVANQQPQLAELNALPGIAGVKDWSGARVARTGWEPSQLPSASQVASDQARATSAQAASDARLGIQTPGAPAAIDVKRQANGVLSFTGSGGDGTGAVKYSGMPQWTSQQGGAGKGSVGAGFNLAEQNQRMAVALQGIQAMNQRSKANDMIDAMASGTGGAVGVAQNKAAMGALGPLIERQMANETALQTTGMTTATQRAGQALDAQGNQARVDATRYGTDVGAKTAAQQIALMKQELDLKAAIAKDGKSGDPEKVAKARLAEVEYMRQTGLTLDGKRLDPGYHQELLKNKMLTGSQPYATGLVGEVQ